MAYLLWKEKKDFIYMYVLFISQYSNPSILNIALRVD